MGAESVPIAGKPKAGEQAEASGESALAALLAVVEEEYALEQEAEVEEGNNGAAEKEVSKRKECCLRTPRTSRTEADNNKRLFPCAGAQGGAPPPLHPGQGEWWWPVHAVVGRRLHAAWVLRRAAAQEGQLYRGGLG